jgi:hypothetical protein
MWSRRPPSQRDAVHGDAIGHFKQIINLLPTYNLSGRHLASVRAIPRDIKKLRLV